MGDSEAPHLYVSEKEAYIKWENACRLYDSERYDESRDAFREMCHSDCVPTSKMLFNIGSIAIIQEKYENAIQVFEEAIKVDSSLCIAYFQLAIAYCSMQRYKEALPIYQMAFNCVAERIGSYIDYNQLGLNYRYYSFEALHGAALCHQHLGNTKLAAESLQATRASCKKHAPTHRLKDLQIGDELEVRLLPKASIFRLQKLRKHMIKDSIKLSKYMPPPTVTKTGSVRKPPRPPHTYHKLAASSLAEEPAAAASDSKRSPQASPVAARSARSPQPATDNIAKKLFRVSKEDDAPSSQFFVESQQVETNAESNQLQEHAECFIALYTHEIDESGYLSFNKDDHIQLINEVNSDWLEGMLNGEKGIVPRNYISKCPKSIK